MAGRIEPPCFYIASGIVFAIAICAAITRTIARWQRFRRFCVDDYIFFIAVTELIAGTILLYVNVPVASIQEQVATGAMAQPAHYLDIILLDEKTQFASSTLIGASIVAVKFSFLAFFYMIIRGGTRWDRIWWLVVLIVTLASAPMVMFSDFIACPYTGEEILDKCVTPTALARQIAIVKASVAMDVVSDVFIISIPIMILWNVRMDLRKKLILAASLCMGIFMIVCAAVRIATANLPDGQIDVLWTLLWQQLEACVAVIVISLTAFRILFTNAARSVFDYASAKSRPTGRDRYECEDWSRFSQRPTNRSEPQSSTQTLDVNAPRESHEMGPMTCQNVG